MIRLLLRTAIFLGSAALGLIITSLILDDFHITAGGFIVVVVIFALAQSVLAPFLMKVAARNFTAFLGGIGLVSTFVALVLASFFGDALEIDGGVVTWLAATVIVWLVTACATALLPIILIKNRVENGPRA